MFDLCHDMDKSTLVACQATANVMAIEAATQKRGKIIEELTESMDEGEVAWCRHVLTKQSINSASLRRAVRLKSSRSSRHSLSSFQQSIAKRRSAPRR